MVKVYASFVRNITMQTTRRKVFKLFIMKTKNDGKIKIVIQECKSNVGEKNIPMLTHSSIDSTDH